MRNLSEFLDMQTRGEDISPNPANDVTRTRRQTGANIIAQSGGDPAKAYAISMDILGDYINRLQEFCLVHNEEPAPELRELVNQVYELRMTDAKEVSEALGFDSRASICHIEDNEDLFQKDNGYVGDDMLGALFAPIEIAYNYQRTNPQADGFVDPNIVSSAINAVGTKVNKATLVRAAKGQKPGILGFLSTGGKKHYNALVAYFTANPKVKEDVLSGKITDESELPDWKAPNPTEPRNPIDDTFNDFRNKQLKQALPYIIGFVVIIVIAVYIASRNKK